MVSVVTEYLRKHGPSPRSELPSDPTNIAPRRQGVTRFSLTRQSASGSGPPIGGHATAVWYLHDEHDPEAVIRAFYEVNPRLLEAASVRQAHHLVAEKGDRWREASAEVTREEFGDDTWQAAFDATQ